ncbi:MAG: sulfatase [Pseudomonadales bacterium]
MRLARLLAGGVLLALTSICWANGQPPNILLLVAEDLSPRLGSYGDATAHTPNLDRLAANGTRFTRVFTTAGVCAPSRAALVTGQHQISFAAQHMRTSTGPLGEYYAQPPAELRAFPELLRQAGYYTYTDSKLDYQFSGIRAGSGPFTLWDADGQADTAWRQRQPGQPFFGLINFIETHESGVMRQTGSPHSEAHRNTQRFRAAITERLRDYVRPADVVVPPYYPDTLVTRTDLARHYNNIALMDQRVGAILAALAADGLAHNTIVIWTTDHGDGLPRAKRELLDSGIHVPMILHNPYQPATTGQVEDRLISFVDLAPTILRLAGIKPPAYLHGQDFLGTTQRQYVFASRDRIDEVMDRQRAVRDPRYKLIRSWYPQVPGGHELAYRDNIDMVRSWRAAYERGELTRAQAQWFKPTGVWRLFDLQQDPFELHNLAAEPNHRDTLRRLQRALDDFLDRVGDTAAAAEQDMRARLLVAGEVPTTPAPTAAVVDDRITLSSGINASIGYRYAGEKSWRLYVQPLDSDGRTLQAKAVRYGWRESSIVRVPGT